MQLHSRLPYITATLSGPSAGGLGVSAQFTVSLNAPAGSGGQVVGFSSTQGSDTFHVAIGGPTVSGITIPQGSLTGTLWLTPSSTTGSRNITITVSGAVIAYEYGGSYIAYDQGTVSGQYIKDLFSGSSGTALTVAHFG